MVSMAQVARAAGVSPATASRVLSGSDYPVRPQTRELVLVAAKELGFRPNMLARGLVTSRTSIIAAIVHDISDPYFGEIVRGIEDVAAPNHYQVLVSSSDRNPQREIEILELLLSYNVDGVVFTGGGLVDESYASELHQLIDAFQSQGRAVIQLAPHLAHGTPVMFDNEEAAAAMTAHLIGLGHRRIAYVAGPAHVSTAQVREAGYRRALTEAGIGHDEELIVSGEFTSEGGRDAVAALLADDLDVTAIFAANDLMAFGVVGELGRRRIAVPGEISVAGFDDIHSARHLSPPLTTVDAGMRRMGQMACEAALAILAGQPVPSPKPPWSLAIRESTAPPRSQAGSPVLAAVAKVAP